MERLLRDLMTKPTRRKPAAAHFEVPSFDERRRSAGPARTPLRRLARRLGEELARLWVSLRVLERAPIERATAGVRARLAELIGVPWPVLDESRAFGLNRRHSARASAEPPRADLANADLENADLENALRPQPERGRAESADADWVHALRSNADLANALQPKPEPAQVVARGFCRPQDLRTARPSAIGAGALPSRREVLDHWREPERDAPAPPDLRTPCRTIVAWVDPARAGLASDEGEGDARAFADLVSAASSLAQGASDRGYAAGACHAVIAVRRSPALPPAHLALAEPSLSIVGCDPRATPSIRAERRSGASLMVHTDGRGQGAELWLAGLWLEGRLDLELARGQADLRWCTIGQPGATAIRWHGTPLDAAFAPCSDERIELELRLYGCVLSAIEVPPRVRVVASGCTFDAGSRAAVAIGARGADLRLVHCTIHGAVEAGELRASSSVFAGAVRVDRRDQGWLRHCLLPARGRAPRAYRSLDCVVQFASTSPTSPSYLRLAENNGAAALANGEQGRLPGAHDHRGRRLERIGYAASSVPG